MIYNTNDYQIKLDQLGKVIIYLRKSREDLVDGKYLSDEETLSRHEGQLQEWAKRNLGYEIPKENIYKEVVSGEKISTRPVFQEVLHQIENDPEIDGLLVVNCSRISRGSLGDIYQIIKTLEISDVKVLTPMKLYNLKNKYDKRFFQDELTRSNDYLEQTKELLSNGKHWSVSQGKYIMSAPPFGYDIVSCKEMNVGDGKGNTLRPNECAKYVKLIFELCLDGYGVRKISTYLNSLDEPLFKNKDWARSCIHQILTNETYYGYLPYGKRPIKEKIVDGEIIYHRPIQKDYPIYKGLHDPIITKELFDAVQERLKSKNTFPISNSNELANPLSGILMCGICGRSMRRNSSSETHKVRVNPLDKKELQEFIREHRKKTGVKNIEIAKKLSINVSKVGQWFGKRPDRFYPAQIFMDKWEDLKDILNIGENKYDKILFEFREEKVPDTINCDLISCSNIGARLDVVEEKILLAIKEKYSNYQYYLENYEIEYTKVLNSNKKSVSSIDKKIEMINRQLKNSRIAFEQEVDTLEEYIARKKELNNELEKLAEEKTEVLNFKEEEKYITIKKSIPMLKTIFDNYNEFTPAQKNELLKSVINSVSYIKKKALKGSPYLTREEMLDCITIDISWKE